MKCKFCEVPAIIIYSKGNRDTWECEKGHQFSLPKPAPPSPIWKKDLVAVEAYVLKNRSLSERSQRFTLYIHRHETGAQEIYIVPTGTLHPFGRMFRSEEVEAKREWFLRLVARYNCAFHIPPPKEQERFFHKLWDASHTGNFGLPHARDE